MESIERQRRVLKADRWEEWSRDETDQRKGVPPPPVQKPFPEGAILIDLVAPGSLTVGQMPVLEAIRRRRSRRRYSAQPLTLEELSFLLWATQGIDPAASQAYRERIAAADPGSSRLSTVLRTVPSGGARHPFETYLLVNRVQGVAPGLYRYLALEHKLLFLRPGEELAEAMAEAFSRWVLASAVVLIWTAIPYRTEWRYSIVAPKLIAQESGHICQNLYLACEAVGAGTCAIGAYDQAEVDALLQVDGEDEFAVYVAPVGKVEPE